MPKQEGRVSEDKYIEDFKKNQERVDKNKEQYTIKNIKDIKIIDREIQTTKGATKIKHIAEVTYKNGVVKRRVVGMTKDGVVKWGKSKANKEYLAKIQGHK
jgi:hypothetical protein